MEQTIRYLLAIVLFPLTLFAEMTLEEKVGQVLMVHFHGNEVNEEAKALVCDLKVGGIIYYNWANGLENPKQVHNLSEGLQKLAKAPLLIAIDQEGGGVLRLTTGFTEFPGNRALAKGGDLHAAKETAFAMGSELLSVGVNMNLAPDVDIVSHSPSPIGARSFGSDAEVVANFGMALLEGFHDAGVITTIKHFPGLGEMALDTHEDLPVLRKTAGELVAREFLPFQKLSKKALTVMPGHVVTPAFDKDNCTTLSRIMLQDVLRKDLGFQGVVISDSLVMEGFLKNCPSIEEGAIMAFNAGCDILLLGGKQLSGERDNLELTVDGVKKIHAALCEAVKEGKITQERLDTAVVKIMALKARIAPIKPFDEKALLTQKHIALAEKVSKAAVEVVRGGKNFQFETLYVPDCLKATVAKAGLKETKHGVVAFTYNAWKNPQEVAKIRELIESHPHAVVVCCGDPQDAELFLSAETVITTLSPTLPSILAVKDLQNKGDTMSTVIFETTQGSFEIKLFADKAPKTVENFLGLVKKGYYEGTIFHRVIKEFMIQGGDPTGTGMGGESIWGKKFNDECVPTLKFDKKGLLAMANSGPNTNGSQFFITTAATPWLNNKHTIFGEVVKGYDIIEKIEWTETNGQDRPLTAQKITKISVKQ